jgi:mannobiose 2-epimerase
MNTRWALPLFIGFAILPQACVSADPSSSTPPDVSPALPVGGEGGAPGQPTGEGGAPVTPVNEGGHAGEDGASDPALKARLTKHKQRLDVLAEKTLKWWLTHGPDKEYGGFHGKSLRDGKPDTLATSKNVTAQARHLWSLSAWQAAHAPDAEVKATAVSTYNFMADYMRDDEKGDFYWSTSRDGQTVVDSRKIHYGQAFVILGLSTYGRVFQVDEAKQYALGVFDSLEPAHDAEHGGYIQKDGSWITVDKDYGTYLHLLESTTALFQATGESRVKNRLGELVDVFVNKMVQPGGYVREGYNADWTPAGGDSVNYGHDLQTSFLVMDAAEALGRNGDESVRGAATTIAENSAKWGYDATNGGYFERGPVGGGATAPEKVWWVQFEAMNGLLNVYELTGKVEYVDRFEAVLGFVEKTWDEPYGEWFWSVKNDGTPGARGTHKGEEWKASYHVMRSLLRNSAHISELLKEN